MIDLGLSVTTLRAAGEGFDSNGHGVGAVACFRAAAGVRIWLSRIYVFPQVEAVAGPAQPLTVSGDTVGTAPSFWLHAGVGMGVRLR